MTGQGEGWTGSVRTVGLSLGTPAKAVNSLVYRGPSVPTRQEPQMGKSDPFPAGNTGPAILDLPEKPAAQVTTCAFPVSNC